MSIGDTNNCSNINLSCLNNIGIFGPTSITINSSGDIKIETSGELYLELQK